MTHDGSLTPPDQARVCTSYLWMTCFQQCFDCYWMMFNWSHKFSNRTVSNTSNTVLQHINAILPTKIYLSIIIMSTIPSRSRFAIAAAVLASMASPTIAAWNDTNPLTNVYPLAECAGDCDDENDCQLCISSSYYCHVMLKLSFELVVLQLGLFYFLYILFFF